MASRLIVILGPTASGKSALAVKIAQKWNGEVISADSRQVYRGFDIGSGKITRQETRGIPHYLLDVADPRRTFTVARFQRLARKTIRDVVRRGKVPILCGGTGLYIRAVVDGLVIPEVSPNPALRAHLEKLSVPELFKRLKKMDPTRAGTIDRNNPRRLIRAIEVVETLGRVPPLRFEPYEGEVLVLGVKKSNAELKKLIHIRLLRQFRAGMIREVQKLRQRGVSWKRLENFGLEYRDVARFLQKKITKKQLYEELESHISRYAKRQMTWFRRDTRIHWVGGEKEALRLTAHFLKT